MPLGGPPLPQATIDVIRQWIIDAAQQSTGALSADGPATLVAVSPTAPVPAGEPARIIVAADAELDTSLIHASNVTLIRSGGDGRRRRSPDAEPVGDCTPGRSRGWPRPVTSSTTGPKPIDANPRTICRTAGPHSSS
jgi:hypothetical protein